MPHFYAECSSNIMKEANLPTLFSGVHEALVSTGLFPLGGIRSRAIYMDTFRIADGEGDYAFVHMTLKIGSGRSLEERKKTGELIMKVIEEHFNPLMESRLLALSFAIEELDPILNYKKNNIHSFIKSKKPN